MADSPPHQLSVIGLGLDGIPIPQAQIALTTARVVAGSPALLTKLGVESHRQRVLTGAVEDWIPQLQADLCQGSVVLLASGDPLFFGIGRLLNQAFPAEALVFYPHISSVQWAFSRLHIPWQEATILSIHGRTLDALESALKQGSSPIAVLTDAIHSPLAIVHLLRDLRLPYDYEMWVCCHLGSPQESIHHLAPSQRIDQPFADPNLVVMQRRTDPPPLAELPLLGIPDRYFHTFADQPGLITKQEVRVLTLSLLHLTETVQILWDIGAGTGSVSVEVARLLPNAQVFAIEQNAAGLALIRQNRQRFQIHNLEVVAGKAPTALSPLPSPDRVVLGGGGSALPTILSTVCQRLGEGGVLVGNFATLEHCLLAQNFLKEAGWPVNLLQVQLARSVAIAEATRFSPLHPVMLLQAVKPHPPAPTNGQSTAPPQSR
ncbi:MAG: precorrin-6y C5,15-methyltransferase (decarboxylating) subunit CbiE [Cyanobacteriota bacterium]|nr:precorrin-6y C5,15-methyltransferase (decarboxylating) subunit CbiE [Cyanobacteriota bacterium]